MDSVEQEALHSWANGFGIELSAYQIQLFDIFLDELWEWKRRINLTGLTSRHRIIRELLWDSLIPSPLLPEGKRLLDVGSGAGFPGIPIKICRPSLLIHLMEANLKKVSFLKEVIRRTNLNRIDVIRGRIEKDGRLLHPKGYHIITTRALARLPQALKWCAPHLISGGMIVNYQGSEFKNALAESSEVLKRHSLFLHKSIRYSLPERDSQRHLLVFMKRSK